MNGKTVVITGATSGIGEVAADRLAAKGARIVFIARDRARRRNAQALKPSRPASARGLLRRSVAPLRNEAGGGGDRGRRAADRRADQQCRRRLQEARDHPGRAREDLCAQSHVLFRRQRTCCGSGWARARASCRPPRRRHRGAQLDFDDLQSEKRYAGFAVYGRSKLCNILFTRELARRLAGTGVTANCLHRVSSPRVSAMPMADCSRWPRPCQEVRAVAGGGRQDDRLSGLFARGREQSGVYFDKCSRSRRRRRAERADAKRLWEVSAKIAGLGG